CLIELLDRSLRSQQQLGAIPAATPVGLVPKISLRSRTTLSNRLRAQPDSAFADAIRWLALALRNTPDGAMPRSVLVTSALPGEGKTTIAIALATILSMAGHRVLLVDADLRRGRLQMLMGLDTEMGLRDLLCGQATVKHVIGSDPGSRFEVIGAGTRQMQSLPDLKRFAEVL